eukprot:1760213-Alexandrium_andersonii.AAC.1
MAEGLAMDGEQQLEDLQGRIWVVVAEGAQHLVAALEQLNMLRRIDADQANKILAVLDEGLPKRGLLEHELSLACRAAEGLPKGIELLC